MINKERLGKPLAITAKAIIMLIVVLTVAIAICGCNKAEANNHRIRSLEGNLMYEIYVDDLTGVQYLRTSYGGICVMVDAEGKPLIWEGAE